MADTIAISGPTHVANACGCCGGSTACYCWYNYAWEIDCSASHPAWAMASGSPVARCDLVSAMPWNGIGWHQNGYANIHDQVWLMNYYYMCPRTSGNECNCSGSGGECNCAPSDADIAALVAGFPWPCSTCPCPVDSGGSLAVTITVGGPRTFTDCRTPSPSAPAGSDELTYSWDAAFTFAGLTIGNDGTNCAGSFPYTSVSILDVFTIYAAPLCAGAIVSTTNGDSPFLIWGLSLNRSTCVWTL